MSIYPDIVRGDVWGRCDEFSEEVYKSLMQEKSRNNPLFKDLELIMVRTYYGSDHVWIIYHDPKTGFGMIDPTAGQFLHSKEAPRKRFYANAFVGNMDRLSELAEAYGRNNWRTNYWPPTLYLWNCKEYTGTDVLKEIWSKHPTKIEPEIPRITESLGNVMMDYRARIAARFQEAGVNWQQAMLDGSYSELERNVLGVSFAEIVSRMPAHLQR